MLKVRLSVFLLAILLLAIPAGGQSIIKSEFRVNTDSLGGDFYDPDIILLDNGNSMIVWEDSRFGVDDIFAQAFDAVGDTVGSNFPVGELLYTSQTRDPCLAEHGDSILVLWHGAAAQWYNSSISPLDSAFSLNTMNTYSPDVTVGNSSFFMVFYRYLSGTRHDILIKEFAFNGDSLSTTEVVNDDGLSEDQYYPRIATGNDGNFVVVWQDERNGDRDIYGQLFDAAGDTIGGNFKINDDATGAQQYMPAVDMDSSGYFVTTWYDTRNDGRQKIFAQIFNPDGDTTGFGGNFQVNDDTTLHAKSFPDVDMIDDGRFVIVWQDSRHGNYNIYAQLYDSSGDTVGDNFIVNELVGTGDKNYPRVSMNSSSFEVTWEDAVYPNYIYKRRFDNTGTPLEGDWMVNDIKGVHECRDAEIDMNESGLGVVVWRSTNQPVGIYFQRFNGNGDTLGGNRDVLYGYCYDPEVSVNEDGNFIVVADRNEIYYQGFNASGDSLYPMRIASDNLASSVRDADVDIDSLGNAVISWTDARDGSHNIYAQRINEYGDTVGGNFKVNRDTVTTTQQFSTVSMQPSGQFLIAWDDYRNGDYDIYGQLYNRMGDTIGGNFRISDDTAGAGQYYVQSDILPGGRYILVWRDTRPGEGGIFAGVIDSTGAPVIDNFEVFYTYGYYPKISASSDGSFVVSWNRYLYPGYDIYQQKFNPDFSKDSTYYIVSSEPSWGSVSQRFPDVAVSTDRIFTIWKSPRWNLGDDIVGKVTDWSFASVDERTTGEVKAGILSISPVTFVGKTDIKYSVDSKTKVEISIFDVTGRKVRTLVDEKRSPGIYSATWRGEMDNGGKSPAGVYFTSFRTEETKDVKKLVLLK